MTVLRGVLNKMKSRGTRTDPCGTLHKEVGIQMIYSFQYWQRKNGLVNKIWYRTNWPSTQQDSNWSEAYSVRTNAIILHYYKYAEIGLKFIITGWVLQVLSFPRRSSRVVTFSVYENRILTLALFINSEDQSVKQNIVTPHSCANRPVTDNGRRTQLVGVVWGG